MGPNASPNPDEARFVGRESELDTLHAALSSIHRRGGRTLFVAVSLAFEYVTRSRRIEVFLRGRTHGKLVAKHDQGPVVDCRNSIVPADADEWIGVGVEPTRLGIAAVGP